jgi:hypothetical protein
MNSKRAREDHPNKNDTNHNGPDYVFETKRIKNEILK